VWQSTAAFPAGTIFIIILIWCLVTIPLTVFGGIAGKNAHAEFAAPCRTNKYPREVPLLPWYRTALPQARQHPILPPSSAPAAYLVPKPPSPLNRLKPAVLLPFASSTCVSLVMAIARGAHQALDGRSVAAHRMQPPEMRQKIRRGFECRATCACTG
jgi:hypothetical protein